MSTYSSLFRLLAAILLPILLSGCFQKASIITINKDGTGIIEEWNFVSKETAEFMKRSKKEGADRPKEFVPDRAMADQNAKLLGEGVTVEKFEELTMEDGRIGVKMTYAFSDINKLKFRPFGPHKSPSERFYAFSKVGDILTIQSPPKAPEKTPEAASKKPKFSKEQWEAQKPIMRPFFVQMKLRFQIKFAGGIISSDADHVTSDTVTMMEMDCAQFIDDSAVMDKMIELANRSNEPKPEEWTSELSGVKGLKTQEKKKLTFNLK